MGKVIVFMNLTLDGVMQAPGGPHEDPIGDFRYGGWVAPYFDAVLEEAVGEMFAQPFDLLLGRKTYDIFAAHWPYVGADDPIVPAIRGGCQCDRRGRAAILGAIDRRPVRPRRRLNWFCSPATPVL